MLSNLFYANDTYGEKNNDVDSPLKTFAATLSLPAEVNAGDPIPVTGYAQVGISGLTKVQVSIQPKDSQAPDNDRTYSADPWTEATILGPPETWGGGLPDDQIPDPTFGFDTNTGHPRLGIQSWASKDWASKDWASKDVADAVGQSSLGGAAGWSSQRRIHFPLPNHRREKQRATDASTVSKTGPQRHRNEADSSEIGSFSFPSELAKHDLGRTFVITAITG